MVSGKEEDGIHAVVHDSCFLGVWEGKEEEEKGKIPTSACAHGIDFDPSTDVSYAEACPGTWASLERPTGFFELTVSKFAAASETSSDNVASHTCGAGG